MFSHVGVLIVLGGLLLFCMYSLLCCRSLIIGIVISADYKISLWGLDEVSKQSCSCYGNRGFVTQK